jgi:hypothetical protein
MGTLFGEGGSLSYLADTNNLLDSIDSLEASLGSTDVDELRRTVFRLLADIKHGGASGESAGRANWAGWLAVANALFVLTEDDGSMVAFKAMLDNRPPEDRAPKLGEFLNAGRRLIDGHKLVRLILALDRMLGTLGNLCPTETLADGDGEGNLANMLA